MVFSRLGGLTQDLWVRPLYFSALQLCTGTLQIFNGTLTEITCSAARPAYRLVDQKNVHYNSYAELPDLFNIEVRPSPTGDNVTVYISGTNRSNNVAVMCINVALSSGVSFNVLFTLILEFAGSFINLIIKRFVT